MNKQPKFINLKLKEIKRLEEYNSHLKELENTSIYNEFTTQEELNNISEEIDMNNRKICMLRQELSDYAATILNKNQKTN